jgi:hypothetical protein
VIFARRIASHRRPQTAATALASEFFGRAEPHPSGDFWTDGAGPSGFCGFRYPSLAELSGCDQVCVVVTNLVFIKIFDRKTQFVIPPNQIAVFQAELREFFEIQIGADFWMQRFAEKWLEVDFLALSIAKLQLDTVFSQVFCFYYINY